MKSPRKAALNDVLEGIEQRIPCTIEIRSPGAFPTVIDIAPDGADDYSVDVWFPMGSEVTPETAARVLGAESEALKKFNAIRDEGVKRWQATAIELALIVHEADPTLTNEELTNAVHDDCEICPSWDRTRAYLAKARRDGRLPKRYETVSDWRRRMAEQSR